MSTKLEIFNFNAKMNTLQVSAPHMEKGLYNCTIIDNLVAKVVTKKSDGSQLQIIEVPCEFEGRKFKATLLSENVETFISTKAIGDVVAVSVQENGIYKTGVI
jgi:hypothetical protein